MSYCVHCGVELAQSEKVCPLCNTKIYDPSSPEQGTGASPYPPYQPIAPERISKKSVLTVLTLAFLVPICLVIVCDVSINGHIVWAGYVVGALMLLYTSISVPILLAGRRLRFPTVWYISANTIVLLCYLFYIEQKTGGLWFSGFAIPSVLLAAFFLAGAIALRKVGGVTRLMTFAAVLAQIGTYCLVVELMLNRAFLLRDHLAWSLYPLVTGWLLGIMMAVIDRSPALKEKLGRKFFI